MPNLKPKLKTDEVYPLPTLVFTPDGELLTEKGLRSQIKAECTDNDLVERLFHSLKSGDKQSFLRFCRRDYSPDRDDANYIIYPLIGKKWLPFRFIFCEKISCSGQPMTAVFFADHMDEFHILMSPASPICRDTSGKLICDILNLRHHMRTNLITPETLFLFGEFPLIEKSAQDLSKDADTQCDLLQLTKMIFDELAANTHYENMEFDLKLVKTDMTFGRPANQIIVPCPLEAYIYLTVILGYILSCLADDHRIRAQIRYMGPGAEISYAIETSRVSILNNGCSNLEELFPAPHNLSALARTASAIAHSFDILTDLSIHAETGLLTTNIGIGLEKFVPNEFRFSDPYGKIGAVLREAIRLLA